MHVGDFLFEKNDQSSQISSILFVADHSDNEKIAVTLQFFSVD